MVNLTERSSQTGPKSCSWKYQRTLNSQYFDYLHLCFVLKWDSTLGGHLFSGPWAAAWFFMHVWSVWSFLRGLSVVIALQLVGIWSVSCSFTCVEIFCSYLKAEMQKHDTSFSAAPSSWLCCMFLTHKSTVNHYYVSVLSPHDNSHLNNAFSSRSLEQHSIAPALFLFKYDSFNSSAASLCSTLQNCSAWGQSWAEETRLETCLFITGEERKKLWVRELGHSLSRATINSEELFGKSSNDWDAVYQQVALKYSL